MPKYTEAQIKWQVVNDILCSGQCPYVCEYLESTYETDFGECRGCFLLDTTGTEPEWCPLYDDNGE